MNRLPTLLALALAITAPSTVLAGGTIEGPVAVSVVRVIDGDTFVADAYVWPGQIVRVSVRLRGVDAPEMKSPCDAERRAAIRARDTLAVLLAEGRVRILNIGGGKYYGRVLADAHAANGSDIAATMLDRGLARFYRGGRRVSCAVAGR